MNKNSITEKQAVCIGVIFMNAVTLIFGLGLGAKQDAWLAVIITFFIMLPIALMYGWIFAKYSDKNLFEIIEMALGKVLGKIIIVILIFFSIYTAVVAVFNIIDFIQISSLMNTPLVVVAVPLLYLIYSMLKNKLRVAGKWCEIFIIIFIIIIVVTSILKIPIMKLENVMPILGNGTKNIYLGVVELVSYPFANLFLVTILADSLKHTKNMKKVLLKVLIITAGVVFLLTIQNTLVLGALERERVYFPHYEAFRRIMAGEAFQRLEMMISMSFLIGETIRIYLFLLVALKGIAHLLKLDSFECILVPFMMYILNLIFCEYQSILYGQDIAVNVGPYASISLKFILPIIIFIMIFLKYIFSINTNSN